MGACLSNVRGGVAEVGGLLPTTVAEGVDAVDYDFDKAHQNTNVELCLSARKLSDHLSFFSKRYLMAVLFKTSIEGELEEVGRTEEVMNDSDLNLYWSDKICICYRFGALQELTVRVYDVNSRSQTVSTKELQLHELGLVAEFRCHLSKIVRSQTEITVKPYNYQFQQPIDNLVIRGEETAASRGTYMKILFRSSLDIGLYDRYISRKKQVLKILKVVDGESIPICDEAEVVKTDQNPTWSVSLSMQKILSKDYPLVIQVFNKNSGTLFGKFQASISELEQFHSEKVAIKSDKPHDHGPGKAIAPQLFVDDLSVIQPVTFCDYLSKGFELRLMVAIDFTVSNGDPKSPKSKHYIDPSGNLNTYQQVIKLVGDGLEPYDSSQQIPAWGFGGKMDGEGCFNLYSNKDNNKAGVEGIMAAYKSAVQSVVLGGPAKLSKVINKACDDISETLTLMSYKYNILLILTDGDLFDIQPTIKSLVKASALPLSILIVGVGDVDFKEMKTNLIRDNGHPLESCEGRVATRDMVTFMSINEVPGASIVETLFEHIPEQFMKYWQLYQTCLTGVHSLNGFKSSSHAQIIPGLS
ncbi:protein BONZAI 3-like isoform X2 [Chenopodium quinoa]|uniref:protein BONZAI 3-like isoform X2 n=1 Tax=Chenopodium quinoa TaxID=63459 RepID=UPI000B789D16|nr:protein BONZAI 3-like isoform X2 [Chenopodium quinoa]